jgi:Lon protease-like protein
MELRKIPLFPLGVVILPEMLLPLHIFEERYKEMMADCLAAERPFGIVFFDGQAIRSVGCLAHLTKVLKRYEDGRMDILTRGGERFVVQQVIEEKAYLEAQVFLFDDAPEAAPQNLSTDLDKARELLREIADTELGVEAADLVETLPPSRLSFVIAAMEGFTPAERQGFLEMTSPYERLQKSVQALAAIVTRNRLTREIQQVIGGNGHPPKRILDAL